MQIYMGIPAGPAFVANAFQVVEVDEATAIHYHLQLYPDMFNAELRDEKKEMWFYYIPDSPRLARDDQGNWMFSFIKYSGVVDESSNVGVAAPTDAAGGIVSFTTTLMVPESVIAKAVGNLKGLRGDKLFGWAEGLPSPRIGAVPIISAETKVSNIGEGAEGAPPAEGRSARPWAWAMTGEGKSSASPTGRNAFTAVVGPFAAATLEQAFQGQSSPISIHTSIKHKFWSTPIRLKLEADWKNVSSHLAAAFQGKVFSIKTDLKGEFNRMVQTGVVKRQLFIDGQQIGADRQREIEARAQFIFDKFVDQATKAIFKEAPAVEPAEARSSTGVLGLFPGKSLALRARHDITEVKLDYDDTINQTFDWENVISANLKGLFDEIKTDPANKAKYFSGVDLGASFQKVRVLAHANAHWGGEGDPGDPIANIGIEIGYPSPNGTLQTKGAARFFASRTETKLSDHSVPAFWTKETAERIYVFDFDKNEALGSEANQVVVKRSISFREAPNVEIDTLSPEPYTTTDHSIEVRADSLGSLVVGPIRFDHDLSSDRVEISVAFASGTRPEQTLRFDARNREQDRFFKIWAAPVAGGIRWKYRVAVTVRGKSFVQPTLKWQGDWRERVGSCELTVEIPEPPAGIAAKLPEYLAP